MGRYEFTAELFEWTGKGAWFFLRLPKDDADDIRDRPRPRRGFGSIRVRAQIGGTTWTSSIFPESGAGSYVLPVKKSVRVAEDIDDGDLVAVVLEVLE